MGRSANIPKAAPLRHEGQHKPWVRRVSEKGPGSPRHTGGRLEPRRCLAPERAPTLAEGCTAREIVHDNVFETLTRINSDRGVTSCAE